MYLSLSVESEFESVLQMRQIRLRNSNLQMALALDDCAWGLLPISFVQDKNYQIELPISLFIYQIIATDMKKRIAYEFLENDKQHCRNRPRSASN